MTPANVMASATALKNPARNEKGSSVVPITKPDR